jgi:hypothetical protein
MEGYDNAVRRALLRERIFVYRLNAFIDYVVQGSRDDREWAKLVATAYPENYVWRIDRYKQSIALRRKSQKKELLVSLFRSGYSQNLTRETQDKIINCPWTRSTDHSALLLTRNVVTLIFSHLGDPLDLSRCMQVNRLFYQAGCAPLLYERKIETLLKAGRIRRFPFEDRALKMHQIFFTLTFVSGSGTTLHYFFAGEISKGNLDLLTYIVSMLGREKDNFIIEMVTDHNDNFYYNLTRANGSTYIVFRNGKYYFDTSGGYKYISIETLRENVLSKIN